MCVCVCYVYMPQHVCEGQRTTEGVLSFHDVDLGDETHVVSLDGKCVYSLSHIPDPGAELLRKKDPLIHAQWEEGYGVASTQLCATPGK